MFPALRAIAVLTVFFSPILGGCPTGVGPSGDDDDGTAADHLFYGVWETGTNVEMDGRLEYNELGEMTLATGSMSLSYSWRNKTQSQSGQGNYDCTSTYTESGDIVFETFLDEFQWSLDRTTLIDSCAIGMIPATIIYAWSSDAVLDLRTDRFGLDPYGDMKRTYRFDGAPDYDSGDLVPAGTGTWETVSISAGTFSYSEGDLPGT